MLGLGLTLNLLMSESFEGIGTRQLIFGEENILKMSKQFMGVLFDVRYENIRRSRVGMFFRIQYGLKSIFNTNKLPLDLFEDANMGNISVGMTVLVL